MLLDKKIKEFHNLSHRQEEPVKVGPGSLEFQVNRELSSGGDEYDCPLPIDARRCQTHTSVNTCTAGKEPPRTIRPASGSRVPTVGCWREPG